MKRRRRKFDLLRERWSTNFANVVAQLLEVLLQFVVVGVRLELAHVLLFDVHEASAQLVQAILEVFPR